MDSTCKHLPERCLQNYFRYTVCCNRHISRATPSFAAAFIFISTFSSIKRRGTISYIKYISRVSRTRYSSPEIAPRSIESGACAMDARMKKGRDGSVRRSAALKRPSGIVRRCVIISSAGLRRDVSLRHHAFA